jgi:soluble P-type ATPase
MIKIEIPGFNKFTLQHLVMDFNGTLAVDGRLIDGVVDRLNVLSHDLELHVLTADTFGSVKRQLSPVSCSLSILPEVGQAAAKLNYIFSLDVAKTVCIGNGRNDREMLKKAAIGIVVAQGEGAAIETLQAADILVPNILIALELLLNPLRLKATLRG